LRRDGADLPAGSAGRSVPGKEDRRAREGDEGSGEGARLRARRADPRRAARPAGAADFPLVTTSRLPSWSRAAVAVGIFAAIQTFVFFARRDRFSVLLWWTDESWLYVSLLWLKNLAL